MAFSCFPFLLPTHSVDCAVHLLLYHSRALLVNSALFLPFTTLKCPFDGPFTALKCPFDGPFTALKCPFDGPFTALKCHFQMAPCPFENLGRTLHCSGAWTGGNLILDSAMPESEVNRVMTLLLCMSTVMKWKHTINTAVQYAVSVIVWTSSGAPGLFTSQLSMFHFGVIHM